ncbi:MAG: energy transducer TonB [Bacteroidetes bacterium]|jgi:colicin import membrane protein|nr:energy transducer TonB [Bacteroidota bacterium]MBT5528337.1 energy transducer TonB [Cytophagia bacterium]MBT3421639.1 energy transducer TonB [Bacteroidota bacterium]MBT3933083.1 energy transducer TonB [Bacteroidota bacterium]MBT4337497.1 energy transducer TonB [Bacteroidota bacterium]
MKRSYEDDGTKKKDRVSATIGTTVFFSILFAIFMLFGFKTILPLPEEGGIEVMLGELEYGSPGASLPEQPIIQPSTPTPSSSEAVPEASETEVATETESEVVIPEKKEEKKENPVETKTETKTEKATEETKVEEKEPERKSNPKYEFSKSDKKSGKGNGEKEGNQGNPNGSPNSTNLGVGGSEKGYGNILLTGRGVVKPPPAIEDNTQKVARVIIEITVNKKGYVIGAKALSKGGGITVGPLVQKAIASAKQARFTADPEGAEEQYGTITFDFKLK